MTGPKKDEVLHEAHLRADTMRWTVEMINTFSEYLAMEDDSPQEDQSAAELDNLTTRLMTGDLAHMGGHVLLALCAVVCNTSDHEKVQLFLNEQTDRIQRMVDDLNE